MGTRRRCQPTQFWQQEAQESGGRVLASARSPSVLGLTHYCALCGLAASEGGVLIDSSCHWQSMTGLYHCLSILHQPPVSKRVESMNFCQKIACNRGATLSGLRKNVRYFSNAARSRSSYKMRTMLEDAHSND